MTLVAERPDLVAGILELHILHGRDLSNERFLPPQLLSLPLHTPNPITAVAQGHFSFK